MQNRILLIEDRPGSYKELASELCSKDIQVQDAFGIEQGLPHVDSFLPNLIVFELGQPKGDGVADLKRMAALAAAHHIPVIYTSVHADEEFRNLTRELGAAGFFEEPLELGFLMMVIQMTLSKSQGLAQLG